ncbi:response regulator [Nannocystis pusilla]|uniref:Response regulator n=1 Tax=Nannocystis pusilla TaxID=889268 RepID=A0A9X3F185_9BACT|nr:response regulator [Nannocystis pusilla]MCY1014149.1 response regulator [Nannocystis pusilla]
MGRLAGPQSRDCSAADVVEIRDGQARGDRGSSVRAAGHEPLRIVARSYGPCPRRRRRPFARALLVGPLRDRGYAVSEAEDGAAAWKLLNDAAPPQIVLLDWMMPRMTGLEVCRRLRDAPARGRRTSCW